MKPIALTPTQQRRLLKLARQTGRAPEHILKFVLRAGFDYCEWQVRESRAPDAESKHKGTIPNGHAQPV